ncbi:hypothetical protein EDD86DRAFT_245272 [Gorgonomyces haynaldii]|nr:hypothetical protein EDD86DRAFT_245272 [Gorgonomyces haynaldii]
MSSLTPDQFYGALVSLVLCLVTFFFLFFLIAIFVQSSGLRNYQNAFSFAQVTTDFVTIILYVAECLLALVSPDAMLDCSVFFICCIPIGPYLVLVAHKPALDQKTTYLVMAGILCLSTLLSTMIYFVSDNHYIISPNAAYCYFDLEKTSSWMMATMVINLVIYSIPLGLMPYTYYSIYSALKIQRLERNALKQQGSAVKKLYQLEEQMTRRGIAILMAFWGGYAFPILTFALRLFGQRLSVYMDLVTAWCMILYLSANPFIYYFTEPRVKAKMQQVLFGTPPSAQATKQTAKEPEVPVPTQFISTKSAKMTDTLPM